MTFVQKNVHKIRKWRLRATPLQMYQSCSCGEMPAKIPFIYDVTTRLGGWAQKKLIKRWSEAESFTIKVNHDYIH